MTYSVVRARRAPDVPEDVDVLESHLNDPNYDLNVQSPLSPPSRSSFDSFELENQKSPSTTLKSDDSRRKLLLRGSLESEPKSSVIHFDDESPYPEVRAAVSSVDDPNIPVNTFRTWFLGLTFAVLISGLNQFFSMRYPSVLVSGIVAQLLALPLGKFLEWALPMRHFSVLGKLYTLNPGPFNIKEHVVITVMANVVVNGAFATDIIATQRVFYRQENISWIYQILLALSIQLIGFSLAGILRKFVVWPASMIWPGALVNSALFHTLHKNQGKREGRHMSRMKFFSIVFVGSSIWYWFPGYIWTGLSMFNWACWIAPDNVVVNNLFGTVTGLGMGVLTFDWAMISYVGSPLVTPWWSQANVTAALVVCFWIIAPAIYYSNTFFTSFMPMSSFTAFDRTGAPYDAAAIITDGQFDLSKYLTYSPVFISATLAVAYGVAFAAFSAVVVHTILWFRGDIIRRFGNTLKDERDIHSRLMQAYPEVPHWWYLGLGWVSLVMGGIAIYIFPTQFPIWAFLLAFLFAAFLSVPLAMIQAITNQQIALQVMHEMVAGYILPGRPVANMIFKAVAYIGTNQAVAFVGFLKLGHYMKIPPRIMFTAQVLAATVSCFVVIGVQNWMFDHIEGICTPGQKDGFICPSTNTFGTASLIWGGIGPRRLFSPGAQYNSLLWFFLVGALAPIPFYFLARKRPLSWYRYANAPVFFAGIGAIPPGSGINYSSWAIVGFIFNYMFRRYRFRWWMRYNYILSAGLDAGVALGLLIVFFTVQFPKGGFTFNWWGNTVWQNTADAQGVPLKKIGLGKSFGPDRWF